MEGIYVVFVIGDDILERLRSISKSKRMSFVLGFIEEDYFGKHFYTIEELDDSCARILQYLEVSKDLNMDILSNGSNLNSRDDKCMLFYVNKEYVKVISRRFDRLTPVQVKQHYVNMKNLFPETDIDYEHFSFFIDTFKRLSKEAVQRNGTLLFSMEPYQGPLRNH